MWNRESPSLYLAHSCMCSVHALFYNKKIQLMITVQSVGTQCHWLRTRVGANATSKDTLTTRSPNAPINHYSDHCCYQLVTVKLCEMPGREVGTLVNREGSCCWMETARTLYCGSMQRCSKMGPDIYSFTQPNNYFCSKSRASESSRVFHTHAWHLSESQTVPIHQPMRQCWFA